MGIKNILFGLCILCFASCKAQDKRIKFPQVGWTLVIPANSTFVSASQFDSLKAETEAKANQRIDLSQQNVLFIIRKDMYSLFGSTITALDTAKFKTWQSSYSSQKKMVIDLIESKKPSISLLDTVSSTENIDGLIFQKFYIKTSYPDLNLTLDNYWYYRMKNGVELSINITSNEKETGNGYLSILKASKFDK